METFLVVFGLVSLVLGVVMVWFRHSAGIAFHRLNKKLLQDYFEGLDSPPPRWFANLFEMGDERVVPRRFALVGVVFICQGIALLAFGLWIGPLLDLE